MSAGTDADDGFHVRVQPCRRLDVGLIPASSEFRNLSRESLRSVNLTMEKSAEECWSSRVDIEAVQEKRLLQMLQTIIPRNRFYADKFRQAEVKVDDIRSLNDLSRLPLTTKQELVDSQTQQPPYGANLSYPSTAYSRLHQTSGTTGRPMRWLDTPKSWDWILECWRQIYLLAGVTASDRFFFPFSFGPFIGFWAAFEGAARLGNFVIAGGGMSTLLRLQAMIENEATVVCCTPTYALRMAEVAEAEGIDLRESSVRLIIVAGEPGGSISATRSRMESSWDARVIDHWGMTEIASLGIESVDRPGGLYLLETETIAEILDPQTLSPVPKGQVGELVITNLGRIGSPLIRYRTRDLVMAGVEDDPVGRELLWLQGGILGRSDDMVTIRGNNVFPSSVEAVLRQIDGLAEYRVDVKTVRSMHELSVTVEPTPEMADSGGEFLATVQNRLRSGLGFGCDVRLVPPGELPRFDLKGKRFFRES